MMKDLERKKWYEKVTKTKTDIVHPFEVMTLFRWFSPIELMQLMVNIQTFNTYIVTSCYVLRIDWHLIVPFLKQSKDMIYSNNSPLLYSCYVKNIFTYECTIFKC